LLNREEETPGFTQSRVCFIYLKTKAAAGAASGRGPADDIDRDGI
jgi:hypothetical protein